MKIRALTLSVLSFVILAASPVLAARKPVRGEPEKFQLTATEWEEVKDRKIATRRHSEGRINEFFSAGYVNAPVRKVFDYYENHENTKKFQDSIKELKVIIDDHDSSSGYRQLEYGLSLPWPIGKRNFVLDLNGKGEDGKWGDIWWSLNEGDISEMMGSYVMTAEGSSKTLVRYHVKADMNTWLPTWLVGFVQGGTIPNVIRQARKDLE